MSLRECFERVHFEKFIQMLSVDKRLYGHALEFEEDDHNQQNLDTILGILSGRINLKSLIENHISNENLLDAISILDDIEDNKEIYIEDIKKIFSKKRFEIDQRLKRTFKKLNILKKKRRNNGDNELVDELIENLQEIKNIKLSKKLAPENINNHDKVLKQLKEIDEFIVMYEFEIIEKEKEILSNNLFIYNSIRDKLEKYILENFSNLDEHISKCFCILPSLSLSGQTEILEQIAEIAEKSNYEELKNIYLPIESPLNFSIDVDTKKFRRSRKKLAHKLKKLRPTTEKYWQEIRPLELQFNKTDDIIEYLNKTIPLTKNYRESSTLFLGGAKTLLNAGVENIYEYQTKGFYELAEHLFRAKHYSHAYDLYLDSYSIALHGNMQDRLAIERIHKAIIGFILSDWAPRLKDTELTVFANKSQIQIDPTIFLNKIIEGENRDILFHCFDQLNTKFEISEFIRFISNNNIDIDWKAIFLERCLQPRIFLRNSHKGVMQIKAILIDEEDKNDLKIILDKINVICNSYNVNNRVTFTELNELKICKEKINAQINKNNKGDLKYLKVINDRIGLIISTIQGRSPISYELGFSCKPVNTKYYLNEKQNDLELVFSFSTLKDSLPINFLAIQIRIDKKYKKFITIGESKKEIGPIEPESRRDIIFYFDVDENLIQEYNSIPIEIIFYEGIKIIEPLDKKKKFDLKFLTQRRGTKSNPYIAGPAVEIGSLYVGREKEIESTKKTLIGQSQDNLPLILGIRRIGKTSLLKRINEDFELNKKYQIIFYDLQAMPESETTSQFLKKLATRIHEVCGALLGIKLSRKDFHQEPIESFEKYTNEIDLKLSGKRILIIFDEFEKFISNLNKWQDLQTQSKKIFSPTDALIPEVLGALRKCMIHTKSISFIISGLPTIIESFKEYESRLFGLMTPIVIKPLNENESKELILAPNLPYQVSTEAINEIIYMSGMQPYLLQLICMNVFNYIVNSGRETVTNTDVVNIIERELLPNEGYFADYYRLMGEDEYLLHAMALCHKKIGSKRRFIFESELIDVLDGIGKKISEEVLNQKLLEMTNAERPLIERNPKKYGSYRIIIGMMGKLLEDKL